MAQLRTVAEYERFERRWKFIFTVFAIFFAGALLDHMLRWPSGVEAAWCYGVGTLAFAGALFSAYMLRDAGRAESVRGGLGLLTEDLSVGDVDD